MNYPEAVPLPPSWRSTISPQRVQVPTYAFLLVKHPRIVA